MTLGWMRSRAMRILWLVSGCVFCGPGGPPTACCGPVDVDTQAIIEASQQGVGGETSVDGLGVVIEPCG